MRDSLQHPPAVAVQTLLVDQLRPADALVPLLELFSLFRTAVVNCLSPLSQCIRVALYKRLIYINTSLSSGFNSILVGFLKSMKPLDGNGGSTQCRTLSENTVNAGLKISFGVCYDHSLDRLSWSLQSCQACQSKMIGTAVPTRICRLSRLGTYSCCQHAGMPL